MNTFLDIQPTAYEFALLMAQGGKCCRTYSSEANNLDDQTTLDEAEESGLAYCSKFKCGYMAVDIDTGDTEATLTRVLDELDRRGKEPVVCDSGGTNGAQSRYHVWFVEADAQKRDELAAKFEGLTVRGRFKSDLMRLPLSKHRNGGQSKIINMTPDAAYAKLQLPENVIEGDWPKKKSKRPKRKPKAKVKTPQPVLTNVTQDTKRKAFIERLTAPSEDRSKTIYAAMGFAIYIGLTKTQALETALTVNQGSASKAYDNGRDAYAYFEQAWEKANSARTTPTLEERVYSWLETVKSSPKIKPRNYIIIDAIGAMAVEGIGNETGLPLRALSQLTGRNIRTVAKVLNSLQEDKHLQRAGNRKHYSDCQNYILNLPQTRKSATQRKKGESVFIMRCTNARFGSDWLDALNGRGGACAVYDVLIHADEPLSAKKLADLLEVGVATVRKHLKWLESLGMATSKPGRTWVVGSASFDDVAMMRGTYGQSDRRAERYEAERKRIRQADALAIVQGIVSGHLQLKSGGGETTGDRPLVVVVAETGEVREVSKPIMEELRQIQEGGAVPYVS